MLVRRVALTAGTNALVSPIRKGAGQEIQRCDQWRHAQVLGTKAGPWRSTAHNASASPLPTAPPTRAMTIASPRQRCPGLPRSKAQRLHDSHLADAFAHRHGDRIGRHQENRERLTAAQIASRNILRFPRKETKLNWKARSDSVTV